MVLDVQHMGIVYDRDYFDDTDEQLSKAMDGALQVHDVGYELSQQEEKDALATEPTEHLATTESTQTKGTNASWLHFQMTSHVIKFLKRGDPKYKSFFVRRMQQLANGERSRILQKRLKGSDSTI